ncbi:hypothetical protein KCU86_g88, partial [Aureobasidium melanogenum]
MKLSICIVHTTETHLLHSQSATSEGLPVPSSLDKILESQGQWFQHKTASIVIIFGAFIGYRLWETRMKYGLMEIIHPSVQSYCYQLVSCYTYSTFRRWFFLDIITVSTETYCRGTMNHIDLAVTNGLIPSYDYGHACYLQYADEFVRLAVEFLDETAVIVGSKRRRRNQLIVCLQRVYRQNLGVNGKRMTRWIERYLPLFL